MTNIEYSERFLKDLKKIINLKIYKKISYICFKQLPDKINLLNVKKIKGHKAYFRIKEGDYRIGIKIEKDTIILMRVLHRKDIYKFFP